MTLGGLRALHDDDLSRLDFSDKDKLCCELFEEMIAFGPRSALKDKKEMNGATQQLTTTPYTKFLLDCVHTYHTQVSCKLSPRSRFKEIEMSVESWWNALLIEV